MRFFPKKSLGQNFLIDQQIISLISNVVKIDNKTSIIEVGPGKGSLTEKILEKSPKDFTVIEKDEKLASILKEKFGSKIRIINDDMMKIPSKEYLKQNLIIFGNLPYNISTQILIKWIGIKDLNKSCIKLVLMFQKEVADRIIATLNSKNYGRLSIISNWRMKIEKISDIEANCFNPPPKVRSTLLTFVPRSKYYELKNLKNLEHITNIFFSQRRKMVRKPMKFLFKNFEEVSKKLSIDLKARPQNLSCLTYYKLCELYEKSIN